MIFLYGGLIAFLTFMYWLIESLLLRLFVKESQRVFIKKNYFIIWFMLVGIVTLILGIPLKMPATWLSGYDHLFLIVLIIPFIFNSNYRPHNSLKGVIAFCLVFPIGEELLFRGVIPDIIRNHFSSINIMIPFPFLKEISIAVLVSAILFGVMHLQYFKFRFNKDTLMKVAFAFVFGIILGNVAEMTESLFYPIVFHILANAGATYLYIRKSSNYQK